MTKNTETHNEVKGVVSTTTTRFCLLCNQELEPRHLCKCPEHNKPFNSLPETDQHSIIQGAMDHAKKLQDEVQDTHTDWESFPKLKYSTVSGYDKGLIIDWKNKLLADARREEREMCRKVYIRNAPFGEFGISDKKAGKEFDDILATLRKESE